jgi:hypothetical protein
VIFGQASFEIDTEVTLFSIDLLPRYTRRVKAGRSFLSKLSLRLNISHRFSASVSIYPSLPKRNIIRQEIKRKRNMAEEASNKARGYKAYGDNLRLMTPITDHELTMLVLPVHCQTQTSRTKRRRTPSGSSTMNFRVETSKSATKEGKILEMWNGD